MAVDSAAVFAERLTQLGLQDLGAKFTQNKWASYGLFAFAVPAAAGGGPADEAAFRKVVVAPLFGIDVDAPEPPGAAAVRR
eukprot:12101892-Alexandrium_andersonii.AAC.1